MKKILLIADQKGWIFDRHCQEIKKRLSHRWNIDIVYNRGTNIKEACKGYDIIYALDPMPMAYPYPERTIMGLRCEFLHQEHPNGPEGLYKYGFPGRCVAIEPNCSVFHVVNKNMFKTFEPIVEKPFFLAQHGVDEEVFNWRRYNNTASDLDFTFRVGVAGRLTPNKGGKIILEALEGTGAKMIAASYGKSQLSKEDMPKFYQNIDVYVCMSKSEGLNNPIMEGGGMGVPVISSRCGAAEEIIEDGVNGFLIDRNANALREKIEFLKKDRTIGKGMGEKMYNTIMENWTWEKRIVDFEKMFGELS